MLKKIYKQPKAVQSIAGVLLSAISLISVLVICRICIRLCPTISHTDTGHLLFISTVFLSYTIVIVAIIRFLTTRLKNQADLIKEGEQKLLEAEKEKMRANLLRAISHDLRTPLTGIIGNSMAYLENQSFLTQDEKEDIVRNIYEDSTWLINMVENLLSITRIRNDKLSITTNPESVEEVVGEALQKMQKRHPECIIRASVPDDLILLPMDAILIEQVTINLLENALTHSESKMPIDLVVKSNPESVSFTIRDYGRGIPEEMLEHVFDGKDYFFSSSDVQKGMGIGLVICKTIISAHHGTISGRNHKDGAEFTFTLPR